jgi:small subunit ribosomal protein S1
MSLEEVPAPSETPSQEGEKEGSAPRREVRNERRERANENPLLSNLPMGDEGETTAMAEAFRAAARQRSKEETETAEE